VSTAEVIALNYLWKITNKFQEFYYNKISMVSQMKTLKVQNRTMNPPCAAVATISHQQWLQACIVCSRSSNAGCMTSAEQCKDGCSLGSMHKRGTVFCHLFLG
jgi:hypothetical protein